MRILCGYCGKGKSESQGTVRKYEHHFCNRDCYMKWRNNFYDFKQKKKKDMSIQRKLKRWRVQIIEMRK